MSIPEIIRVIEEGTPQEQEALHRKLLYSVLPAGLSNLSLKDLSAVLLGRMTFTGKEGYRVYNLDGTANETAAKFLNGTAIHSTVSWVSSGSAHTHAYMTVNHKDDPFLEEIQEQDAQEDGT